MLVTPECFSGFADETDLTLGRMKDRDDIRTAKPQYVAAELDALRAAVAEAERRINRLMVVRRRQLAAARSHQCGK